MEGVQQDLPHANRSEETRRGDSYGCWLLRTVLCCHYITSIVRTRRCDISEPHVLLPGCWRGARDPRGAAKSLSAN